MASTEIIPVIYAANSMATVSAPLTPKVEALSRSQSLGRSVLTGTSMLGVSVCLERGLGFLANVLAARFGGAGVFGGYSLALTTANNMASYAGAGIGTTAARFSGKFNSGSAGYKSFLRTLALCGAVSVAIATFGLWICAGPIARNLLANESLTPLLRAASFSAGAFILLECFRGLFIGQRCFKGLLLLSVLVGCGFAIVLPLAARKDARLMVMGQAAVIATAIAVCALFSRKLSVAPLPASDAHGDSVRVSVKTVWGFGFVQLASIAGLNAAGWWVASLVTRADSSLGQMGLYAISSQLRNLVALAPGLISQSSYALFTEEGGETYGGPDRATLLCTFLTTSLSILICGVAVAVLPWVLRLLYGKVFSGAVLPASLAIATALIHMGGAPAAARLTIVSLRFTGFINAVWAVLVAALGFRYVPGTGAAGAVGVMLIGHLISGLLVLAALRRSRSLPAGLWDVSLPAFGGSMILAVLAVVRSFHENQSGVWSLAIILASVIVLSILLAVAKRTELLPSWTVLISRARGRWA